MRLIQINANNIVFTLKIKIFLCKIVINYLLSPFFMVFFHLYNIVFLLLCFPISNNVYPKCCQGCKKEVCQ